MVDILTKPLVKRKFVKHRDKLGVAENPFLLGGSVEAYSSFIRSFA